MKKLSTNEIRQMWLTFFKSKGHHFLPPASLVPVNDPSLLWINSGVATLKPYFEGRLTPPALRLTNSQKAIRTNDIENVGVTARHQTMFEMLGNFSIGDYFKKEALQWAWELLTSPQWFAINPKQLYVTVFNEDQETYRLWKDVIGVPTNHIFKMGRKTNFWDIGSGPAGPNTEIFFDRGSKWDPKKLGTKLISDDIENDRYVEIWNIVFSQFNNDGQGNYSELPRKNIDTGAGLERLASISQQTPTNFETDLFWPVIQQLEQMINPSIRYSSENYFHPQPEKSRINTAFKVIADHLRAVSFAIADGVLPSNKERGYVVRRLIRRAQVYGRELGLERPFLSELVETSTKPMSKFYPEVAARQELIKSTIQIEETKFLKTLHRGAKLLEQMISKEKKLTAKNIWLLFESFGFPIELTLEIAQQNGVSADIKGLQKLRREAQAQSRQSRDIVRAWNKKSEFYRALKTPSEFVGWLQTKAPARVSFIFRDEESADQLKDENGFIILDRTPFYAERGGQAADHGTITGPHGVATVVDVQLGPKNQAIHQVSVQGVIHSGDFVEAKINLDKRRRTQKNHSGTHLLHSALREVLGDQVMQSGSYNDEQGLRLDFSFPHRLTRHEIARVQAIVNEQIHQNHLAEVLFCPFDEATNQHRALAFFGDKYDKAKVRVVKFGNFSSELCGGTHVASTGEIEALLITEVASKGKGVIRVKAITSHQAIEDFLQEKWNYAQEIVAPLARDYQTAKPPIKHHALEANIRKIKNFSISNENWMELIDLVKDTQNNYLEFQRQLSQHERHQKLKKFGTLTPVQDASGINRIEFFSSNLSLGELKVLADQLRTRYPKLIAILGSKTSKGSFLVVALSPELAGEYSALEIFRHLPGYRTKGGGNATFAQGKYEPID